MKVAIVLHSPLSARDVTSVPYTTLSGTAIKQEVTRIFIRTLVLDWPIIFFAFMSQNIRECTDRVAAWGETLPNLDVSSASVHLFLQESPVLGKTQKRPSQSPYCTIPPQEQTIPSPHQGRQPLSCSAWAGDSYRSGEVNYDGSTAGSDEGPGSIFVCKSIERENSSSCVSSTFTGRPYL